MKARVWVSLFILIEVIMLVLCAAIVYRIDPFFHYRKPDTTKYGYSLDNERSQNDGICRYFDYDAIITGTSMTQNFRTSEMDQLFGCHSIKVPFSGGSYKEIDDNIKKALQRNKKIKYIVRGLDMGHFIQDKDLMRVDMGEYPKYLYDETVLNDIEYLLSIDAIQRAVRALSFTGITSFDDYDRWQNDYTYGIKAVVPKGLTNGDVEDNECLSETEKEILRENIEQNVISTADEYQDVTFLYFYTPYSIVYWNKLHNSGKIYKQLEAEKLVTEMILEHPNIMLFSLNTRNDIIADLNNYKDESHYGGWINSLILKCMKERKYIINSDNYKDYLKNESAFLEGYDYESINGQDDYDVDLFAAASINHELTGAEPVQITSEEVDSVNFRVDTDKGYNYISFEARKLSGDSDLSLSISDDSGQELYWQYEDSNKTDTDWKQYCIDISDMNDSIITSMSGIGRKGYLFKNVEVY